MAPKFAALAAEFPAFDPELAPDAADADIDFPEQEEPELPALPLPEAAKTTVPADGKPSTLLDAFDVLCFPEHLHESFLNLVGANPSDDPSVVSALPFDVFREGVASELVLDDGRKPSLFEQGRFYKFFKDLAKLFSASPPSSSPAPSSLPSSSTSTQPIFVQVADTTHKLPLKDFLDQTLTGSFELLDHEEITKLRNRFVTSTGASPGEDERPTDQQISAMAHRIRDQTGGRLWPPFAEFAIFGPFNIRAQKMKTFAAMVLSREGTWSQKVVRGPNTFAQWEASWNVYAATLIMLDVASVGALKTYFQAIRRLYYSFPNDWGTIVCLEEEMRSEQWDRIRQSIMDGSTPPPLDWNPKKPWQSIIPASRPFFTAGIKVDWWQERIMLLERSRSSRPQTIKTDTVYPAMLPSFAGQPVIQELAGASHHRAPAVPDPHPEHQGSRRQQQKRKNNFNNNPPSAQQNQRSKGASGLPVQVCYSCGKPGHVWKNCPSGQGKGGKNGGKGRGKNGGKGRRSQA